MGVNEKQVDRARSACFFALEVFAQQGDKSERVQKLTSFQEQLEVNRLPGQAHTVFAGSMEPFHRAQYTGA